MTQLARAASTCRRCQSPVASDDLRCAICAMATVAHRPSVTTEQVRILRCDGCGAAITFDAAAAAPRCAFCASVMHVEVPSDPLEVAERLLPFTVRAEDAHAALRQWLSTLGFFRPSDLAKMATLENIRPILWCGWLASAEALVSWTADSDAGAHRSAWAPHAGQTPMRFDSLVVPASRGLRLAECYGLTPAYQLGGLVDARAETGGAIVERFDVQRSAARSIVVKALTTTAASRIEREGHIPGSSFRNVHVSVLLQSLRTERIALPAYVLAYRYEGKSYRVIVHGQNTQVVLGAAPYSYGKIALVVVAVIAFLLGIFTVLALVR